jgi:hypothetical protein
VSASYFYRFKDLYERSGEEGLKEISRRKPNLHNRMASELERGPGDRTAGVELTARGE